MVRWPLVCLALGGLVTCADATRVPSSAPVTSVAQPLWRVQANPTVRDPRLVPEALDAGTALGLEPGGGVRFIAGGLRVLRLPNGGVLTSAERFPNMPDPASRSAKPRAFSLPARLGGGSLFVVDKTLLRSDSWLSPARPVYTSPTEIADVWLGLDRLYVRSKNGAQVAVDPRRGAVDKGPWPEAPSVTSYRALDGWRAAAVADLRGVMASFDAGATWRPLELPIDPQRVGAARLDPVSGEAYEIPQGAGAGGDFLFVQGAEPSRPCFALAADRPAAKLTACPARNPPPEAAPVASDPAASRIFGASPLLAAVEDGWPLDDGTALVARSGALGRVRLSDGVWVALKIDAFPPRPSRCHALPLLVDEGAPGLGFACAEAAGRTTFYVVADPSRMTLVEARAFDDPREVLSFANGAVAVRGSCRAGGAAEGRYCILSRGAGEVGGGSPRWAEARAPSGAPDARLLVSSVGRVAFLAPPWGKLDDAHITFVEPEAKGVSVQPARRLEPGKGAVKLAFPVVAPDVRRALESGVWLDGFEEREPGVFGGWVDASGAMLGVEVGVDGSVRVGAYVRDAGSPAVSGRYGLGWGVSRRGYQTTDGGMTWTTIAVPDGLSVARERACGPIGCTAAGWIRVGWGPAELQAPDLPSASPIPYRPRPRDLDLDCEPDVASAASPQRGVRPAETLPASQKGPEVGFYGTPPPAMRADDQVVRVDAASLLERGARVGPLVRTFAWGPRSEDWAHVGRWSAQWLWPYGAARDVHSTSPTTAPFATLDSARRALLGSGPVNLNWTAAVADESTAALMIGKRFGAAPEITGVFALEADRNPAEIHRVDGEPFAEVDFAIRAGGHWYVATQQAKDEPRAAVVYRLDGSEAHEFARVPRSSLEGHPTAPRLARRTDGRAIGVVVDGQDALRWVLPLDIETGARGEPQQLGSADLGDRSPVLPCTDDETGWVLDTTWNAQAWSAKARVDLGRGRGAFHLGYLYVRVRLSEHRGCLERVSGTYETDARDDVSVPTIHGGGQIRGEGTSKATLPVSVLRAHTRQLYRCHAR